MTLETSLDLTSSQKARDLLTKNKCKARKKPRPLKTYVGSLRVRRVSVKARGFSLNLL